MALIRATVDPALHARIVRRHALHYTTPRADRPSFVRAASGLAWFEERLAIVQDDALLVALVNPKTLAVDGIDLPLRADGARTFDVVRGNKKHKPDFEACLSAQHRGLPTLFAFGSGSRENRESIAVLSYERERFESRIVHVPALYAALRAAQGFLSSELNLEGALLLGDTLRLFQRSNGTALSAEREAACATCDLSFGALLAHLEAPLAAPVPALHNVRQYDLGRAQDARLTFTDAALLPDGSIAFCASAEGSPNAYDDGEVAGSALGKLDESGARLCPLHDEQGAPVREKVEGIALAQAERADRAYVVFDPDDHRKPATLAEIELTGF